MSEFNFFYPIEVRYGDLDPQGHLNNAKYLTYFEQARIAYITHLGLWNGKSFMDIGIILADTHIKFLAPVLFQQPIHVGVRTINLGNKSLSMEYCLQDIHTHQKLAEGSSVLVAYNYQQKSTIPIPEHWRSKISSFEGLPESTPKS